MSGPFTIGVDFGSESARALLLDVGNGREIGIAEMAYPHGVITDRLPGTDLRLPPEYALQDPQDYLTTLATTVRKVIAESGVTPDAVIGIGIDFTSCTMLPVTADGTPLCRLPQFAAEPHAWPKLWKHHAAQDQADRVNALAVERGESFLQRFGGRISSEWLIPKSLEILEEAPHIYRAADRLIEAQDWIVWQLIGSEVRSIAGAAYKATYLPDAGGYPAREFFGQLDPAFADVADTKLGRDFCVPGDRVGDLTGAMAQQLGLATGIAVAAPNMDAVVSVSACGVAEPGAMVMVMGTSTCDFVLGPDFVPVEGSCGAARDVVTPGLWAFEAGQNAVGDMFGWFVREVLPERLTREAQQDGVSVFEHLESLAGQQVPGEHGLLALDWWSGNRSVLVDTGLSGLVIGLTLGTAPEDIYRALLESTAFGTRRIVEAFTDAGVVIDRLVACGGLPRKSPLLMQLCADITGLEVAVVDSRQIPARGAALHASVAAGPEQGGHASIAEATATLASPLHTTYRPDPAGSLGYQEIYHDYVALHDYFGRGGDDVMRRLKRRRNDAVATANGPTERNRP
ncbi:ribulokinase [Nakamurella lactea]|uniref:ribulokinase n=1 Tax=Nakamurella lactea TaxID=459515 RepID=UPI000490435B